jgi:RES domain-containing protein
MPTGTGTAWRITTARFAAQAFSGEGARRYGGRWNPKGWPVVYTAASPSLALLEMLVQDAPLRAHYVLIQAQWPESLAETRLESDQLPEDWRTLGGRDGLQAMGRDWLAAGETAILSVPSAVMPLERNRLLNPLHPDFAHVRIGQPQSLATDVRLLRHLGP